MVDKRTYTYRYSALLLDYLVTFDDGTQPVVIKATSFEQAKSKAIKLYKQQNWILSEM